MGITERREREKEEIRHKILDAARELFAAEGYEKVTMRRIAALHPEQGARVGDPVRGALPPRLLSAGGAAALGRGSVSPPSGPPGTA